MTQKIRRIGSRIKKTTIFSLVFLMLIFAITCEKKESKEDISPVPTEKTTKELKTVKISIDMWIGFGPFVLGKEKGLFEKRGIKVEPIVITGTGEKNSAMIAKHVLGRTEGLDSIVLSVNQGAPGTVVLAIDESVGGDGIAAKKEIKSIADLKGKKVAFQSGLPGHFLLLYLLNTIDLTERNVDAQIMDSSAAGAAFIAGKVDAAVTWEPWLSKAANSEHGHLLTTTREHRGVIVDALAMHPDFVRDHPEDVKKIILGWFDAIEYWRNHREEANAIMAKFFKIPVEELEAILEGVDYCDLERNLELFGKEANPGKIYEVGEKAGFIWQKAGIIKREPLPVLKIINGVFIRGMKE